MEILSLAESRGVKIRVDGNNLTLRAPKGTLTPELRQALTEHKAEVIAFLRAGSEAARAPIPRAPVLETEPWPLSPGQARLWFIDRWIPESTLYHVHFGVRMKGILDESALSASLTAMVERHAMLRVTFPEVEGQPRAIVAPTRAWNLPIVDLGGGAPADKQAELGRLSAEQATRPFDLARGPLMRTVLVRLAEDDRVLLVTQHHIMTDGWSLGVFLRDLTTLYGGLRTGRSSALVELPIRYVDYVRWQKSKLLEEDAQNAKAWWKQHLAALPRLELPTPRAPLGALTHAGNAYTFALAAELASGLRALAYRESCTPFVALLTVWAALLYRYSQQEDFGIGTVTTGRDRGELRDLIGFFVNTLVLRCDLSGDPRGTTLIARIRGEVEEALGHQEVPFDHIVSATSAHRGQNLNPLVRTYCVLNSMPMPGEALAGLGWTPVLERADASVPGTAKFELGLTMVEAGGQLAAILEYATDLFDASMIERMVGHFRVLAEGLVAEPGRRVSELPLLTAAERHQILVAWNETTATYPSDRCIHELFEAQVDKTPDAVAVVFEQQQLTYRELDARANQLAHHLQRGGVGPEVLVALCVERSLEMVVALLGILKAGAAYVPLDPTYPKERLAFMLEDTAAPVLLTQEPLIPGLPEHRCQVLCLDADRQTIGRERVDRPASGVGPKNLAYVIYTSGSTGKPKGVLVEHRSLVNLSAWHMQTHHVGPGDRTTQVASLGFDAAVWEIWPSLVAGACLCIMTEQMRALPSSILSWLSEQGVTSAFLPTPLAEAVLAESWPSAAVLRTLLTGGDRLRRRPSEGLPFRLINHYGPTECTVVATWGVVAPAEAGEPPIGRPITNTRVYVLDPHEQPVPAGVPGELYIGGVGVARGYLRRPELTAERYIPDPFGAEPGARLYKTGDLCRWRPDGQLEFLGRVDHQVKIRGFRIELGEIESVLTQHPSVREAVVLAREDAPGDKRLVAYVVAHEGLLPQTSELRNHLQSKLPEYMVPAAFVLLPNLPLTPHDKVDRKALPAPDLARPEAGSPFTAPRTPVEEVLAGIWATVLRVQAPGVLDNFFTLGGDSILAIQVISKAQQAGLALSIRQIFQHPTIASLAEVATPASGSDAEQGAVAGPVPLTPIQHWFFEQERAEPPHFNQSVLLSVRGPLDLEALRRAVQRLVEHHDALRLRFMREGDTIHQFNVGADPTVTVAPLDLSAVPLAEQAAGIEAAAAQVQASLCLETGPLMRVAWMDLGEKRPGRLLIVIHHLAVDGVSWRILLEDLETAYTQACRGEPLRLPRKTTSFRQWSERLRAHAQSESVLGELPYWRSRSVTTAFPVDDEGGPNTVASARTVEVVLEADQTRALLQEVPEVYQTEINDVLLTALAQALVPWAARRTLRIDLEGHGREPFAADLDVSRTVGWFTTLFPVVLELPEEPLEQVLKRIQEQLRGIPNRGMGFGLLRYLRPAVPGAELGSVPPAEVSFNYLGQFDGTVASSSLFAFADESMGPAHSPRALRTHRLDINVWVSGGRLRVGWTYSEAFYRRETIEGVAQRFLSALRGLVAHCQSAAEGRTPSDWPLSFAQEWRDVCLRRPAEDPFHNVVSTVRFRGRLDEDALERSLTYLVQRHDVLRTRLIRRSTGMVQRVERQGSWTLTRFDLQAADAATQAKESQGMIEEEGRVPFRIAEEPLVRGRLVRLSDDERLLILTMHHAITDNWSYGVLLRELTQSYEAYSNGHEPLLPKLAVQFPEFAVWQRQQYESGAFNEHLRYWRQQLGDLPDAPQFSCQGLRAEEAVTGSAHAFLLDRGLSAGLPQLAQREGATLFIVLMAAYQVLLYSYSGSKDLAVSFPKAGRTRRETEELIGFFVNLLVLRTDLSETPTFRELLGRVRARALEAYAHEDVPLHPLRLEPSVRNRVRVEFNLLNAAPTAACEINGVTLEPMTFEGIMNVRPEAEGGELDLELYMIEDGGALRGVWFRAVDRVDARVMGRMMRSWQRLLELVVANPDGKVEELRHRLLDDGTPDTSPLT